ncbi:Rrf2 family transcriptional regulator [Paenibacillus sp. UNC499MF]|uniref:RrF2 family transcriptional regulator n=1 Tax=Paenibacillus sp. UNC499MF TaxID=1502751 RepID=UPI00089F9A92|nr:Rrf2 family transcriptional regulator [Paenibacillus sp. UNC499MF]SEG33745.1 Rrf2 family protein [Paenibacillus sp. UNC499MF]
MNSEFTIAVHSLVLLAHLPEHMASSDDIASNVCTHSARIRKIMGCLRKAGFVRTKEGCGGGFILNHDPDEITLGDIYQLTSLGTLKPNWCSGDQGNECLVSANMQNVMDNMLDGAEQNMIQYLKGVTIGSMLRTLNETEKKAAAAEKNLIS